MSVLRFTDSNYPFGIFKIFLIMTNVDNLWCTYLLMSEIIVIRQYMFPFNVHVGINRYSISVSYIITDMFRLL